MSRIFTEKDGSDLPPILVDLVYKKVHECYMKAEVAFKESLATCKVEFGLTGRCAGMAYCGKNLIRIHSEFLLRNAKDMIEDTVPHEIAHILVWKKYGRVLPHGKEWQAVMLGVFGILPSRCHSYKMIYERQENGIYKRVPVNPHTMKRV